MYLVLYLPSGQLLLCLTSNGDDAYLTIQGWEHQNKDWNTSRDKGWDQFTVVVSAPL